MKKQIWETWSGKKCQNQYNKDIYIETEGKDWHVRYNIWIENLDKGCPCPMPKGHIMFRKNATGFIQLED